MKPRSLRSVCLRIRHWVRTAHIVKLRRPEDDIGGNVRQNCAVRKLGSNFVGCRGSQIVRQAENHSVTHVTHAARDRFALQRRIRSEDSAPARLSARPRRISFTSVGCWFSSGVRQVDGPNVFIFLQYDLKAWILKLWMHGCWFSTRHKSRRCAFTETRRPSRLVIQGSCETGSDRCLCHPRA